MIPGLYGVCVLGIILVIGVAFDEWKGWHDAPERKVTCPPPAKRRDVCSHRASRHRHRHQNVVEAMEQTPDVAVHPLRTTHIRAHRTFSRVERVNT